MFCSNCGKTIRPEDDACQHCGASLGEGRFYGNTYTSSQVRLPVEALSDAPEGGMISYTRTSYMSYDNQPEDDVYSNTTYRPLLSEEEDLSIAEAEEAAAAEAAAQAAAAQEAEETDEFAEEAPAEEETAPEAEDEFEPEAEEAPVEDVPGAAEDDDEFIESTSPLPPLKKAAISPRVLSYMEELDRQQERRASGGGLRMPSFLKKKAAPAQEDAYEEELPEAEDIAAGESAYEEPVVEIDESEISDPDYAETEYADESADETYSEDDGAFTEDAEEISADEYVSDAETDGFEHYEDVDYAEDEEGEKAGFDFSRLKLNIGFKALFKNRAVTISIAAVLIVAVIIAGVTWLRFVTLKRPKIVGVTYTTYTQGIELLQTRIGDEYRSTMQDVYLTNTSYANESFAEDMAALNALMPAEADTNDELFITSLTIIQDSIAEAIKADANAELNGTTAEYAATSELKWQAIDNAITKLSEATNPGELTVIVSDLESVVAPTPTPSPTPTKPNYTTLSNGMMDSVEVKQMQNRLINLGYLDGEADGDFGNGTEAAVKAFQRAAGMTADGIATADVQAAMYADDAPRVNAAATETVAPDTTAAPENPSAE